MNTKTTEVRCEVCGKVDYMLLFQKHKVCGDCTRKRHKQAVEGKR